MDGSLTRSAGMSSGCESGLWPAVQSFVAFFATNILAHAASIHLPAGADTTYTTAEVILAILTPVGLGEHAFHIIGRWGRCVLLRVKATRLTPSTLIAAIKSTSGGNTVERAAVAGGLAISIPLRYRKLAATHLDQLYVRQRVIEPDQWGYIHDSSTLSSTDSRPRWRKLFSLILVEKHRTDYFVLPPETRFKTDKPYIVISSSNVLPQLIAIAQLVLSSRQLYLNYNTFIKRDGLSSPYLAVVPYILMTMVNFVANTLVGSYPQVILVPKQVATRTETTEGASASGTDAEKTGVSPMSPGERPTPISNNQLEVTTTDGPQKTDSRVVDYDKEPEEDIDLNVEFSQWLQDNYEYLDLKIGNRPHRPRTELWAGAFLISLVTLVIGLLTRFRLGNPTRAAWFLVWLYAAPSYGVTAPFLQPLMDSLNISVAFFVSLLFLVMIIGLLIGLTGGTAVVAVRLMEAMCDSVWEFSVRVWILIGFSTFFIITTIILLVILCLGLLSIFHPQDILMIRRGIEEVRAYGSCSHQFRGGNAVLDFVGQRQIGRRNR